jgi:methionyl aminopeptidase
MGSWGSCVEHDGWTARIIDHSICVQYEHTVAITEDGPQILTLL